MKRSVRDSADRLQGKVLDKSEFPELSRGAATPAPAAGGAARLRGKAGAGRARPKTIHVDSSALHQAEGMLATKQPSSTNLTGETDTDLHANYLLKYRYRTPLLSNYTPSNRSSVSRIQKSILY